MFVPEGRFSNIIVGFQALKTVCIKKMTSPLHFIIASQVKYVIASTVKYSIYVFFLKDQIKCIQIFGL